MLALKAVGLFLWRCLTRSIRERSVVTVDTHIQQPLTERRITMSIWNRSDKPVVVDSWTVHIPIHYLFPDIESLDITDDIKTRRYRRFLLGPRLITNRWVCRFSERARIARGNHLAEVWAQAALGRLDAKHQLLDVGATVMVGPKERVVQSFPKPDGIQGLPVVGNDAKVLVIIPSCRIVGQQRRFWGMQSGIINTYMSFGFHNSNRHS